MNTDTARILSLRPFGFGAVLTTIAAVLAIVGLNAVAQYQVNNQIYGNSGPSVRYGYGPGYANYPTSRLMPSENRNLVVRSGALPSDVRMGYASVGPLAPQGFQAYVPPAPSYAGRVGTVGNYVNSSVGPTGAVYGIPPRSPVSVPTGGSIRYGSVPMVGTGALPSVSITSVAPISPAAMPSKPLPAVNSMPQVGSIRYGP